MTCPNVAPERCICGASAGTYPFVHRQSPCDLLACRYAEGPFGEYFATYFGTQKTLENCGLFDHSHVGSRCRCIGTTSAGGLQIAIGRRQAGPVLPRDV